MKTNHTIKPVTSITDIEVGDTVIITGAHYIGRGFQVEAVKVTEQDGTEIILNYHRNHFFNLGMYLEGSSWVKKLDVVKRNAK